MTEHRCMLDVVLRATFEWREVANLLASFDEDEPEVDDTDALEAEVFKRASEVAHSRRAFSEFLVRHFGKRYQREIRLVKSMTLEQLVDMIEARDHHAHAGLVWALASDPRPAAVSLGRRWVRESRQRQHPPQT